MEVIIKLDLEDWSKFQAHVTRSLTKTNVSSRQQFWKSLFLWFCIGFVMTFTYANMEHFHLGTGIIVLMFPAVYIGSMLINNKKHRKVFRPSEQGSYFQEQKYIFDDQGFTNISEGYVGKRNWSSILKIERDSGLIFIYIDTIQAYFFPENKLENPDSFYEYVSDKYNNSNNRVRK